MKPKPATRPAVRDSGMSNGPTHIKDLVPDPRNARKHNPQNLGMLADSLRAVGAARSIVIDEENEILAGNGVCEAAGEAGITRVQVVEADGETIIAVRRRGLTPEQKRKLALYDNRVSELATWDLDVLREFSADGLDLQCVFEFPAEFIKTLDLPLVGEKEQAPPNQQKPVTCPGCGLEFVPNAYSATGERGR
jgi:hypothetical protein